VGLRIYFLKQITSAYLKQELRNQESGIQESGTQVSGTQVSDESNVEVLLCNVINALRYVVVNKNFCLK
jgi:hypothetical protein